MVQPEGRVAGADEHVAAGVAAHGVVAAAVDADVAAAGYTLHDHLKVPDVVVLGDEIHDGGGVDEHLQDGGGEIALQAAGVPVEWVLRGFHSPAGDVERGRTQVHGVVDKRPAGDAAAACAGGEVEDGVVAQGQLDVRFVGDVRAVARHGGVAAVEDGGLSHVIGVGRPVPVSVLVRREYIGLDGRLTEGHRCIHTRCAGPAQTGR